MIRKSQLFGSEQEPVDERPSKVAVSTFPVAQRSGLPEDKREKPRECDLRLSPFASEWSAALPAPVRPDALCVLCPGIANRIAICWPDAGLAKVLLDDLLGDMRDGRRGFPILVVRELELSRA